MNLHTNISRKHWLSLITVMVIAALLITTGILFAANQTPRPDAIALQGLPAPEQGRIFAQPDDVQEDFELPPVEKEPLTYPNMDSHLNRLVEETESTRRETTSDTDGADQSVEPVLVTFYVSPEHINTLREYLEANGVFVRNVGDDYVEAHVPPLLLAPASEQPGVLRVDTVIPPRSTQSRGRVISQGVDLHGADAWHNADYRGRNVKVGVIDRGFEGFSQLQGNDLPNNVAARCYFDGPQTPSSRLADCEVEGNHGTAVILFAANQTPRPDAIALQGLPAPEQGRIFAQPDDVQEDFELPPVEKEPLTYPNMDSHLNRLVEETESTRRETTSDTDGADQSVEPVLVTFYVSPDHINALREYLETNGVFVRNVGDDYVEAHVPPLLLAPASEQPGVLRVDTVIPPRSTQSRGRVISQGVDLHGADAWHNADYRGRNVKVGVIDRGFEGFSQLQGNDLPNNVAARCYFDGPQTPSSRLADCEVEGNHGTAVILFAANQTPRPDAIALQGLPAPEQGRIFAQPDDVQEAFELPPVEKEPLRYPNMDSHLNRLVEKTENTRRKTTSDTDQTTQSIEPVLVTFYVSPDHINALREYLETNGVFVRNVGDDYIEAHVPPLLLAPASEQPGVLRVDTVIPPRSTQSRDRVISQGVGLHGADAWHNAGYRGRNVKVGVIDSGFEGFSQLQGGELPNNVTARCYFDGPQIPSSRLADCEVEGNHGTAVAETVADVVPDMELYISNPYSLGDLRNAVDWMVEQGVTVINVSLGYPYDGPGDGTSPSTNSPLKTIDAAVSSGVTWINAAGNDARKTWYGTFHDPNNTGVHHFTTQDVGNNFILEEGEVLRIFMRWHDDWGKSDCNLDLEMYQSRLGPDGKYPLIAWDRVQQDGSPGKNPFAFLASTGEISASLAGPYFLVIRKQTCTDNPDWIQLTAWVNGALEHHSPSHHIGNPEESRSLGMMAVGATHYWDTQHIAPYSNRGPTIDGRTKPDITGIACARTMVFSPLTHNDRQCWFAGTSQAAPHVAGLAALIRQRFPDYGPRETVSYLQQHASDRGTAGADNTWGHGLATLPVPEVTPTGTVQSSTLTRPMNVTAVSNAAGELAITWEGGDNADSYLLIAVNLQDTADYKTATVPGDAAKAGTVVGLTSGGNHLVIVVALQTTEAGLGTLYGTAGPVPVQTGASSPTTDRAALVALYNATSGANWADNRNWLSNAPMGEWYGVITDASGRVIELNLDSNQLTGTIPSSLGNLSELTSLFLHRNQLTGSLPSSLGGLSKLEVLSLGGNQFTGQIPSSLGGLSNLTGMYLWGSELTGPVPSWLGNLSNLEAINLGDNQLSGVIPSSLGNLSELTSLRLYSNRLTGSLPSSLGGLSKLEVLSLGGNQFTGQIPSSLGGLSNLTGMYLWGSALTGPVPSWLGNLSNLEALNLSENQLTGAIPSELANLTNLEELYLTSNQLTGPVPTWLGNLFNLTSLGLSRNQFTGTIPTELSGSTRLTLLALNHNQLTGSVPSWLGNLTDLTTLSLRNNQLSGSIPNELGNLTRLTLLHLENNQLSGAIPSSLVNLTNLEDLLLGGNSFIGCIPPALQDVATNDLADLGLPFCLNPTTRSFNSSKGNRTPDQVTGIDSSIIETDAVKCDYATQHDADKDKYELTMTENEQATVTERLWLCLMETDSDSTMSP